MPFCSFVTLKLISKPIGIFGKTHVSEDLRLVYWQKRFYAFDLHDQVAADNQINSIAAIQQNVLVTEPAMPIPFEKGFEPAKTHMQDTAGKLIRATPAQASDEPRSRIRSRCATTHQIRSS